MYPEKLQIFNSNIIKWYSFEKNKIILQIGKNNFIKEELEKKTKKVDMVDNITNITGNAKYDYILIYGYENYANLIKEVKEFLKEDGKLLVIGNNETGINNWSKATNRLGDEVTAFEIYKKKFHTIKDIKKEIENSNLLNINVFYAFPDYKSAEIVFNEKYNISKNNIEKYSPNISENEIKTFDEINVLKTLVSNDKDTLEFFANSYLIEISQKEITNDVQYVSFNNCRKEQYQLMTIIKEDVVEKRPTSEKAKIHLDNMCNIINDIKQHEIQLLDYESNGAFYSKFIKNEKTLEEVITEKATNIEDVVTILNKLKEEILLNETVKYEECINEVNSDENEEILKKLTFLKKGYWDMIPKNCFYIDNKFIFFDQEWEKDYLPVEFILYRAIINCYDLVRKINVDDLFKKLEILEYKKYFERLDESLREEILDKQIYKAMYDNENVKAIDNLINDNKSLCKENTRKDEYIKELEDFLEDFKRENNQKQEHIQEMERYIENLKEDNSKKQEYINNLERIMSENQ